MHGDDLIEPTLAGSKQYLLDVGESYSYTVSADMYDSEVASYIVLATANQVVTVKLDVTLGQYPPGWDKWRPSFGIWVVDPDGGEPLQLGSWDYDIAQATYVDAQGVQAPFIQTFAEPLIYSGIDMMPAARLGVVKRGITYADLIAWYNTAAEDAGIETITPENYADFVALASTNSEASEDPYTSNSASHPGTWALPAFFDDYTGTQRSYYPTWLYGLNNGVPIREKALGAPSPVQSVIAVESYDARVSTLPASVLGANLQIDDQTELDAAVAWLTQIADTQRALRNFEAMQADIFSLDPGASGARPLGGDGSYYIGSVWITLPSDGIPAGDGDKVGAPGSGDIDGDGAVTAAEALTVARFAVGSVTGLTPAQILAADMDGDGDLTMSDALAIMRRAVGL
jgi:hypothetical protein